jgi:3' terminal RNA ribose 2'-O-methyltransferase Hen1
LLVTISYSGTPATDLGFLLFKHPDKLQTFELSMGKAHVFYPEATDERCTVALMLDIDPIALVRNKRFGASDSFSLGHYVNDRPYASSSMLAAAIGQVFRTAMTGRCDARPELAASPLGLNIELVSVPSRGIDGLVDRLFTPIGWQVTETSIPLDAEFPKWGVSRYSNVRLTGTMKLAEALRQLYVLLPVLDDSKHYWVSDDEVAKLLRAGEGWLAEHPDRELITRRYLVHQRSMIADATARLTELDDAVSDTAVSDEAIAEGEASTDDSIADAAAGSTRSTLAPIAPVAVPLHSARADAVIAALKDLGAHRVVDLGCGEGALLKRLMADREFTEIAGTDVSNRSLTAAEERLNLKELSDAQRQRITLMQSSITYQDDRITGFDAAVLMEVIEHVEPERLVAVEAAVFAHAQPGGVVVTTPNSEYNALYPSLAAGDMRHPDHRFEWTRNQFRSWCTGVGDRNGYTVQFRTVGEVDGSAGSPTQLALFRKA